MKDFRREYNYDLDTLLETWYTVDKLPSFLIKDARVKIVNIEDPHVFFSFNVFNQGQVDGIVYVKDKEWLIPEGASREIRMHWKDKKIYGNPQYYIDMPMSRNVPSRLPVRGEFVDHIYTDTSSGSFLIDASCFLPDPDEIVVDNEDPGFRIVKSEEDKLFFRFFKGKQEKKYATSFSGNVGWQHTIDESLYGYPVQSALLKHADAGKQRVEWRATLPRKGKYEVFFNYVGRYELPGARGKVYNHVIYDGGKWHDVVSELDDVPSGWVSLGIFDFSAKEAKVILSDKENRVKVSAMFEEMPAILVADAVKWCWVGD